MRVALTVWKDRISPVFDSARTLMITEIINSEIKSSKLESFNPQSNFRLAETLDKFRLEVLICGAISKTSANIIETRGIRLISFIGGNVKEVISAYAKGRQLVPTFLMPGCESGTNNKKGNLVMF